MAEDLKWELTILEVVHGFYLSLLQETLKDDIQVPAGLDTESLHDPAADIATSVAAMRRWLRLLDLAVTPQMVRAALTANVDQDLAEALLRHYAHKRSFTDFDRDKTDFVATFLYRNPRVPGQWALKGYSLDGIAPVPPFEIAALEILGDVEFSDLTPAHDRILNEFDHLREEVEQFHHFEEITDSSAVQRARQLKVALGDCFCHPRSLAVISSFNAQFGKCFDELFKAATNHIRNYADKSQQAGSSGSSRVHGDITVKQLAEVEDTKIMKAEYARAQEHFRHIAKLKKAVDAAGRSKAAASASVYGAQAGDAPAINIRTATAATAAAPVAQRPLAAAPTDVSLANQMTAASAPSSPKVSEALEQSKLKAVEESVRAFVRAANPKFRQIVPMKFGNFTLTPSEADAFCADHLDEKSFRADNARTLVMMVAIVARVSTEIGELKQKQNSTYLWKTHGDSIEYLLRQSQDTVDEATRIMSLAQQRGLAEKATALSASIIRLQQKSTEAADLLRYLSTRTTP